MFIPLGDDSRARRPAWATFGLVCANVLVHLVQRTLPADAGSHLLYAAGAVPWEIAHFTDLRGEGAHVAALVPPPFTILTSLFLHGGAEHLLGNIWFLWVFGRGVEAAMGSLRFLCFFMASGVVGAVAQVVITPWSRIPMVGASGAIAGILGAYLLLRPRGRVQLLLFLLVVATIVEVPSFIVLPVWVAWQLLGSRSDLAVATWAHVGGFVIGALACRLFVRSWTRPVLGSWSSPG